MANLQLLVFAGPNGSGKSSITGSIPIIGQYINADLIQKTRKCSALEAAQNAAQTRQYCIDHQLSFTMETVLSSGYSFQVLEKASHAGYDIMMIYVLTHDPEINIRRVSELIKAGGNFVEEGKIKPRYIKALAILPKAIALCRRVLIFDNSADRAQGGAPSLIFSKNGSKTEIHPSEFWSQEEILALTKGEFQRG